MGKFSLLDSISNRYRDHCKCIEEAENSRKHSRIKYIRDIIPTKLGLILEINTNTPLLELKEPSNYPNGSECFNVIYLIDDMVFKVNIEFESNGGFKTTEYFVATVDSRSYTWAKFQNILNIGYMIQNDHYSFGSGCASSSLAALVEKGEKHKTRTPHKHT